jgi:hypothetical protein
MNYSKLQVRASNLSRWSQMAMTLIGSWLLFQTNDLVVTPINIDHFTSGSTSTAKFLWVGRTRGTPKARQVPRWIKQKTNKRLNFLGFHL